MKRCIINLATPDAWYLEGQARLLESLRRVGYRDDILSWRSEQEVGAPSHKKVPYAFKAFAFVRALEQGYDVVVWVDASFWAISPVESIFEFVENAGYMFPLDASLSVGQWCSDAALLTLGVDRESAFDIPMFSAGFMGLNLTDARSQQYLREWHARATDGTTFAGAWTNNNRQVSNDPRVLGHRHDMTAGSVIAYKLGMTPQRSAFFISPGGNPEPATCFLAHGMFADPLSRMERARRALRKLFAA